MSAQQTIYERIKEDLKDDKILQNVTLERLWWYFEQIKDITGSGGSGFTNGNGAPSGGADGDYYIQTDGKAIWYNNSGVWGVILSNDDIPISVDDAQDLYMGIGTVTKNAWYNITDGSTALPAGVTSVRIRGLGLTGVNTFDQNFAEAFVTALGVYVPCTYDVATNKISIKQVVYAINLTQTSSGTVNTVDKTFVNLLGETPVITRIDDGIINFNTTTFEFVEHEILLQHVMIRNGADHYVSSPILLFIDENNIQLRMTRLGDEGIADDQYNNTYLEFYILIAN